MLKQVGLIDDKAIALICRETAELATTLLETVVESHYTLHQPTVQAVIDDLLICWDIIDHFASKKLCERHAALDAYVSAYRDPKTAFSY